MIRDSSSDERYKTAQMQRRFTRYIDTPALQRKDGIHNRMLDERKHSRGRRDIMLRLSSSSFSTGLLDPPKTQCPKVFNFMAGLSHPGDKKGLIHDFLTRIKPHTAPAHSVIVSSHTISRAHHIALRYDIYVSVGLCRLQKKTIGLSTPQQYNSQSQRCTVSKYSVLRIT